MQKNKDKRIKKKAEKFKKELDLGAEEQFNEFSYEELAASGAEPGEVLPDFSKNRESRCE